MRWRSGVIWMLRAALPLYAPSALAADMPLDIVGSWSQQKDCSNSIEFDQKGYTTFVDGKNRRCEVKRVVAVKNQSATTPAWRLEVSCGRTFYGGSGELGISTVIRINIDAPDVMALAEERKPVGHARWPISLTLYFRCR